MEQRADDASVAEIHIIDFIGDWFDDAMNRIFDEQIGVTARAFVEQLSKIPEAVKALHVHINSPGGDVQGAVNIANALREQQTKGRTVETFVDGIAASAASIVAMAGSAVHMADNALMMVHNPWTIGVGNAAEMRKSADILDTVRTQIIATYQWHSPLESDAIAALMDAETWMGADEAIANGFATDTIEGLKAAASIDPRGVKALKVPDRFKDRVQAWIKPEPPPATPPPAANAADVLRRCREADALALAEDLITAGATLAQVEARLTEHTAQRTQAQARERDIRALCATAKLPELADGYIAGSMAATDVQAHLTTITARLDQAEIDTALPPDGGQPAGHGKVIDASAIYRERNRLPAAKE